MDAKRRYQRYAVIRDGETNVQSKVLVEGEVVRLVNFSVGGLCIILSKKPLPPGVVSVSAEFENRGKIDLIGKVVRMQKEGDMWRIAIDLTKIYKLDTLRKV
jgi:hypothetical protein